MKNSRNFRMSLLVTAVALSVFSPSLSAIPEEEVKAYWAQTPSAWQEMPTPLLESYKALSVEQWERFKETDAKLQEALRDRVLTYWWDQYTQRMAFGSQIIHEDLNTWCARTSTLISLTPQDCTLEAVLALSGALKGLSSGKREMFKSVLGMLKNEFRHDEMKPEQQKTGFTMDPNFNGEYFEALGKALLALRSQYITSEVIVARVLAIKDKLGLPYVPPILISAVSASENHESALQVAEQLKELWLEEENYGDAEDLPLWLYNDPIPPKSSLNPQAVFHPHLFDNAKRILEIFNINYEDKRAKQNAVLALQYVDPQDWGSFINLLNSIAEEI